MTDASKPPNRLRRKLIVAFVLVLVSMVSWWYWPRGDARFVGKWSLSRTAQGRPIHTLQMSRNGGGWAQSGSSGRFTYWTWSVKDNTLRLGYFWHTPDSLSFRIQRFLQSHAGWHPWIITGEQWEIREVTTDSIVLSPGGLSESYTLTRIPE